MTLSLKQKLISGMLAMGLLPLLGFSAFVLYKDYKTIYADQEEQMNSLYDETNRRLSEYFGLIRAQSEERARSMVMHSAIRDFTEAVNALDPASVKVDGDGIRARYVYQQEKTPGSSPSDIDRWVPSDERTRALQQLYIVGNNNKIGEKDKFLNPGDGSMYSQVHAKYHPAFKRFVDKFGYYDMFLVDAKTGYVVYTDFKEIDFMSNVKTGPLSDTNFSRVVKKAMASNKPDEVFLSDFETYMPSYNGGAGFVASPIVEDGETIGVFALQIPLNKIDEQFEMAKKRGKTADGFMVGPDMKLRSKSTALGKDIGDSIPQQLEEKVKNVFDNNFKGFVSYYGGKDGKTPLMGVMGKLDVPELGWSVVLRITKEEVLSDYYSMLYAMLFGVAVSVLIISSFGYWFAINAVKPVQQLARGFFQGAEKVGRASGQVGEAVSSMVAASEETSAQSKVVRKNSGEASGYVSSVSTAVEELNISINDISQSIGETNVLIDDAVQKAQKTDEVVRSLGEASKKITEVVSLINDLAEQTNLLALNAAIEAARAGDAGRGFAVVADEVKKLASHTSQATVDIKEQVKEILEVSDESVKALHTVVEAIHKIRDNATTVSAAVEEQSGVAKQIAGSVKDAATRVQQVDENMNGIEQAANDTGVAADQVSGSSNEVQGAFNEMKTQMQKVLDQMGVKVS